MTGKKYARLLLFSLAGVSLWFFGNLYEGMVIAPNLLVDPLKKVLHWQAFFTVTNPIYFYIPLVPAAIFTVFFLYRKAVKESVYFKKHLGYALVFLIIALVLSIYVIAGVNLKLFFGDIAELAATVYKLSILWNVLNIIRTVLLAFAVSHLFNAYIFIRKGD